jgi:hypothetical protein
MKKILTAIIAAMLFTSSCIAQSTLPQSNTNVINNSLDKFVGTWVWQSGTETVKIILKRDNILMPSPENYRMDAIIGFHIYTKGTQVVESSISYANTLFIDKHSTILGSNTNGNNILGCTIQGNTRSKLARLTLTLNTTQTQLKWVLTNTEGIKIIGYNDYSSTLPRSITLTKAPTLEE